MENVVRLGICIGCSYVLNKIVIVNPELVEIKGQLISKCLLGVIVSTKIATKIL